MRICLVSARTGDTVQIGGEKHGELDLAAGAIASAVERFGCDQPHVIVQKGTVVRYERGAIIGGWHALCCVHLGRNASANKALAERRAGGAEANLDAGLKRLQNEAAIAEAREKRGSGDTSDEGSTEHQLGAHGCAAWKRLAFSYSD